MHKFAILLLCAAALGACGQIEKPDGTLEGKVRFVAKTADMVLGAVGGRDEVRGIEADGRTLVIKINTGEGYDATITGEEIRTLMKPEICKNKSFTDLINEGAAIRVVLYARDGRSMPPATVASCPSTGTT